MTSGLIGHIARHSLHDGPGIRTTVFFKGCPLHCPWCHNPEFIAGRPEVAFYPERCIGCGDCGEACPEGAIMLPESRERINRQRCSGCGRCADVCPSTALRRVGSWYTAECLTEIILRDRLFYETSGGGVTLSGGEPTGQLDFLGELLPLLKRHGLHIALQTCGLFSWPAFAARALELLDRVYYDLKIARRTAHAALLGRGNTVIMDNLARLLAAKPEAVVARIPLIPGYTATEENVGSLAQRLRAMGVRRIALLPYHPWGRSKARAIGRMAAELPEVPMSRAEIDRWQCYFTWAEVSVP